MIKNFHTYQSPLLLRIILLTVMMLSSNTLFAEGSKDLYPSGKTGTRAYLRSSLTVNTNWPFANLGTHYVYANAEETITLASSAQDSGANSGIRLYDTAGNLLFENKTANGLISTRAAELAGPQLVGGSVAGRYTPLYYKVPTGKSGIYRVEFLARGTGDPGTSVNANANWTQQSNAGIMAWDISVINTANTSFISGRVYTNVLNLTNGTSNPTQPVLTACFIYGQKMDIRIGLIIMEITVFILHFWSIIMDFLIRQPNTRSITASIPQPLWATESIVRSHRILQPRLLIKYFMSSLPRISP